MIGVLVNTASSVIALGAGVIVIMVAMLILSLLSMWAGLPTKRGESFWRQPLHMHIGGMAALTAGMRTYCATFAYMQGVLS